ncbi:maleylpyruvate isomerase family mycothiol-dependent enzyme [Cryobacterium gelidum]|uniref:Maleylpyruvate isomerase family mycothiol-dependent enzyme n=1 Tax=Cryobacterium gelidum TaxID=1259164 RepID=A0A4V3IUI9_9MICO|nr:maleylpyruvate isomerase family mycothiol-dependent enzyme [Cryobacterium gelidum]TFD73156.1 maleylpyruvate isomerase family mycothiol-dependent enzyme [Cryobacterium gelidum]
MNEIWAIVHKERDALIQDLKALNTQQWTTPSLGPGWDIHAVLAHRVYDAKTTRIGFVSRMIAAGFDFDRINAAGIARERSTDPTQTLANFQGVRSRTTSAPAPLVTRLVEVFAHGEDIRRPLGIDHEYPVAEVAIALRYQAKTSVKLGGGKERLEGLRIIATDTVFDEGVGKEVRGTAIALLLAASGRPVHTGELIGPGALSLTGTN